jgi:hypothetical protein
VFENTSVPLAPEDGAAEIGAGLEDPSLGGHSAKILSAADEALLRDLGSGSGLLELTREAYSTGDVHNRNVATVPAPGALPAGADGVGPVSESGDRQFQIVGTALALANKLVQAHKAEVKRARFNSLLAWSADAW